jgi:CRP-like cAMP-binding protein
MSLLERHSEEKLLEYLTALERKFVVEHTEAHALAPGDVLIRQGSQEAVMYICESGELEVVDERIGEFAVLTTLKAGDVIGEMAFLDGKPRSATVRARIPTVVRAFDPKFLQLLADEAPEILGKLSLALAEILSSRLRRTQEMLPELLSRLRYALTATGTAVPEAISEAELFLLDMQLQIQR